MGGYCVEPYPFLAELAVDGEPIACACAQHRTNHEVVVPIIVLTTCPFVGATDRGTSTHGAGLAQAVITTQVYGRNIYVR